MIKPILTFFLVAGAAFAQLPDTETAKRPTASVDKDGRPYHLVVDGDTLHGLAATYRMTLQRLVEINHIKNNTIQVGQKVYLSPVGTRVEIPPPAPAEDVQPGPEIPKDPLAAPADDSVLRRGIEPGRAPSAATVFRQPKPTFRPKVATPNPATATQQQPNLRGIFTNRDAGTFLPTNPRHVRPYISSPFPAAITLMDLVTPLPLLDNGRARKDWSSSQENIATWWENKPIRTVGILTSFRWNPEAPVPALALTILPTAKATAPIQVTIPGAYLPMEIDTNQLRRWASSRLPIEIIGHLAYLDGPGPLGLIQAGNLLSPWELVAQHAKVHPAGSLWVSLTVNKTDLMAARRTAPPAAPAAPQKADAGLQASPAEAKAIPPTIGAPAAPAAPQKAGAGLQASPAEAKAIPPTIGAPAAPAAPQKADAGLQASPAEAKAIPSTIGAPAAGAGTPLREG